MFPFLTPIGNPGYRRRFEADPNFVAELQFFTNFPVVPKLSVTRVRNTSGGSDRLTVSSGGSRPNSRPNSRTNNKSPYSAQSSARSVKSSPIALVPSDNVPPPSRHRNKGLETSSAMLELFGGGAPVSTRDPFTQPHPFFGRRTEDLGTDSQDRNRSKGPHFSNIPDTTAHSKTTKIISRAAAEALAQPGPELYDEAEKFESENMLPDPKCPAEELLSRISNFDMEQNEDDTPESDGDWENVKKLPSDLFTSEPGPDLGDEELIEETGGSTAGGSESEVIDAYTVFVHAGEADATDSAAGGSEMSLFIKGAEIINDDSVFAADILIENGVIKSIGVNLEVPSGCEIVDAAGRKVLPAGIDVHTHFSSLDASDDFSIGCNSAVAGGTATVVEMVVPKSGESISSAINRVRTLAGSSACNIALSVYINCWSDAVKQEMQSAVSDGVNSFIVDVEGDDKLFLVLDFCRGLGAHVRVLPENRNIVSLLEKKMISLGITGPEGYLQSRPEELESERVSSVCVLSQLANCPVSILSLSSAESVSSLEKARATGSLSHAEVATAAMVSDSTHYFNKCLKHAAGHLTDVPLRTDATAKLIATLDTQPLAVCTSGHRAISSNSRIGCSDFTKMPKGSIGVEERMAVLWEKAVRTGRMNLMRFVAVTSSNAAKMFNIYPKKGRIAVGADADLVLWDVSSKRKLGVSNSQSTVDISIYEGITVHSHAAITIVGGKVSWKEGTVTDAKGALVPLTPFSPYMFSVVQQREKVGVPEKVEREPVAATNGVAKDQQAPRKKSHFDSGIDFGGTDSRPSASRVRNPPGGRSTGFW